MLQSLSTLAPTPMTRYVKAVRYRDMPTLLKDFIHAAQHEGVVIDRATMISLCAFMGLTDEQTRQTLSDL